MMQLHTKTLFLAALVAFTSIQSFAFTNTLRSYHPPASVFAPSPRLPTILQSSIHKSKVNGNHRNAEQHNGQTNGASKQQPNGGSTAAPQEPDEKQRNRCLNLMRGLSFNSGFLNGVFLSGVLGKVQAVGPVTDSWTKNALSFATGDVSRAMFVTGVLMSFGTGAFLNGLMNPNPELFDLKQRNKPLGVAAIFMAVSASLVYRAHLSASPVPDAAFFLVCAANGMQNSFSSQTTSNLCRTSHFTGTTTDMFTILGQRLRGNTFKQERIPIYAGLTAMFWLGGFFGTKWTRTLQHASVCLALSSLFYLVSAIPLKFPRKFVSRLFQQSSPPRQARGPLQP